MTNQTLRRSLHVASAAFLLLVPIASWTTFRVVVLGAAVLAVGLESVRLRFPGVRAWLARVVPVFRPVEASQPCGAMWLAVGYGIASLFASSAPMAGILVGAVADPAAAWIGEAGRKTTGKTWRGSAGHFAVASAVLLFAGFSWTGSFVAAAVGTVLERWPGPFNDNLLVPPAVAASVSLLV